MPMSERHYEALAEVFRTEHATTGFQTDDEIMEVIASLARSVADICKRDNSRFDRDRFLRACGLEVEERVNDKLRQLADSIKGMQV